MSLTALFSTIYRSHYTISVNFYVYLQYFQKKKRLPKNLEKRIFNHKIKSE